MTARLQAQDPEGLTLLSAMLQDAALRVGDMAWLPKRRRFVFGGSRFRWEAVREGERPERIGFGAHVDTVLSVARKGIDQDRPDDLLVLLALAVEPPPAGQAGGDWGLGLIFAGGGAINLRVECIDMSLADLGTSYATRLTPDHDLGPHVPGAGGKTEA